MRVAAIQLNSGADKVENLAAAERQLRAAASQDARLAVLPEKFNLLGGPALLREGAEPIDGPTIVWARQIATELSIWLVAGSFAERDGDAIHNTSVLVDPDGQLRASYRKIHMFDVEVEGKTYRESDVEQAGSEIVLAEVDGIRLGMSICYDLRFPELFRILAVRGAKIVALPAAFTVPTGKAHWETLIRARAIENQSFVIAAGQVGRHPGDYKSYGDSMVVDPWGDVLARAGTSGEQAIVADLDFAKQQQTREQLPSLANRRPDTYLWPAVTGVAA